MGKVFNNIGDEKYSDEHYTPIEIYTSLGPFRGGPCAGPNTKIGSEFNWTKEDNGLYLPWPKEEFLFVNPPFSLKIDALDKCYEHGNCILLLAMQAYAQWHDYYYSKVSYKFEIGQRLKFGGAKKVATFSTCLFPFGDLALERIKKSGIRGILLKVER
jgi:hypothetical protein